jgi:hypothetical protein
MDEPRKRRGFPGTFNGTRYCRLKKAAFPKNSASRKMERLLHAVFLAA